MSSAPPNIVWIITTQWRAQAAGYAGDINATTPFLDAFAAKATNFAEAVSPHPFGPFARAALLTGVPCPENGVRDYFDPLPAGSRTVADDLNDRGYRTAWFGKWHLAPRDQHAALVGEAHARTVVPPGARGGFEFWEGFESGFLLNDPWLHGTRLPAPTRFRGYQSDVLCKRAKEWIHAQLNERSHGPRPWFCVVSLEPPHPPYDEPAAGVGPRDPERLTLSANVPQGGQAEARVRRELAGYYAHIEATDRALGRLVARLPVDTIVVVTSAHGDMHGAHGLFRKGWPHEESIRIPLLVGRVNAAAPQREDAPVSLLDLRSMTLAWADGRLWCCPRRAAWISMPGVVNLPDQCDRPWHGLRTREWKVVWNDDGAVWLAFDLRADPGEQKNLAGTPEGNRLAVRARPGLQSDDQQAPR